MAGVDNDTPELAAVYDRISDSQFQGGLQLLALMGLRKSDLVLDVGCGTGRLALHAAGEVCPSGSVTGIDPSPHRVRVAQEKQQAAGVQNVSFSLGQGENLGSLPDGHYDAVYYSAVFHWIGDKKAALREAYRVLKPGGTVGIYTGCRGDLSSTRSYLRQLALVHAGGWPARRGGRASLWLNEAEMEALLAEAGFAAILVERRPTVKYFQSPDEYFLWLKASSSGRRSNAPEHVRAEFRRRFAEELEKRRTPQGIPIESSLLFATASRPRQG